MDTTCRHCHTGLAWTGHVYADANGSRRCPRGGRHPPRRMPRSGLLLAVHGDEIDADDPLVGALRAAGN